jgi:ribosomal protein L11 methyltransferase
MFIWIKYPSARWLELHEIDLVTRARNDLTVIEQPGHKRLQIEVPCDSRSRADRLVREFGGRIEKLQRDWLMRFLHQQTGKSLKIGNRLVITNVGGTSVSRIRARQTLSRHKGPSYLVIPAALAFGTGAHATTAMSLRLLEEASRKIEPRWSTRLRKATSWQVVDLGTGSGILALAARRFGAKRVTAIDNDPQAIATARENARINRIDRVHFKIGDVRKWKMLNKSLLRRSGYGGQVDMITANLFSELLIEVLPKMKMARWLILSGILRNQERGLKRALSSNKIGVIKVRRRGKWVAILAGGMRPVASVKRGQHRGRPSKKVI